MKMIIVVDTNAAYRSKVEDVLTRAGFVVFALASWRELYAQGHHHPDMILIGETPTDDEVQHCLRLARQMKSRVLYYGRSAPIPEHIPAWDRQNLNELPKAIHDVFSGEYEQLHRFAAMNTPGSRLRRETHRRKPRRSSFVRM